MKPMKTAVMIVTLVSALAPAPVFCAPEDVAPGERHKSCWELDSITGDWWNARTVLAERGIEFQGCYSAEVWGNTTGGLKRGSVYTGVLDFGARVDLEKLVGWSGASLSTTWLWLSGRDASEDLAGNFFTISNIAGFNTLRCYELWFQQNLWEDKVSLRVGNLGADTEFVISDYGSLFLNGTFGWPAFLYLSLPEGGPGWPVGTPGVRLALDPADWLTFMTAAFQGDVFAQDVNRHGFHWRLDRKFGYLFLNEAQVRWNKGAESDGLPGQFKAGAWFHSGNFADSYAADEFHYGNYGFYFILDQKLFSEKETIMEPAPAGKDGKRTASFKEGKAVAEEKPGEQGLGVFTRFAVEPNDRNFLDFYFDAGLAWKGLIPGRDADELGVAIAYGQLSRGSSRLLRDEGAGDPGCEIVIEATYNAVIAPWLSVQPDLQVILHPGGTRDLGNALVIGARATVVF